ncbi:MAG: hypothetical protein FWG64_09110 [Firmicutes bacterium]|nr:hypothetical protein [Bacillota bacterium]
MNIQINNDNKPPKDPLNTLFYVIIALLTIITIISMFFEPSNGNTAREVITLFSFISALLLGRMLAQK